MRAISYSTTEDGMDDRELHEVRDEVPADLDAVEAIREALADMDAGDHGTPLEEFDREFRRRHGLP
jgi:hypothetical protein